MYHVDAIHIIFTLMSHPSQGILTCKLQQVQSSCVNSQAHENAEAPYGGRFLSRRLLYYFHTSAQLLRPFAYDNAYSSPGDGDRPWLAVASAADAFSLGSLYTEESGNVHPCISVHVYEEASRYACRFYNHPAP